MGSSSRGRQKWFPTVVCGGTQAGLVRRHLQRRVLVMVSARLQWRMERSEWCSGPSDSVTHLQLKVITYNAWAWLHTPKTSVVTATAAAAAGAGEAGGPGRGVRHAGGRCCW